MVQEPAGDGRPPARRAPPEPPSLRTLLPTVAAVLLLILAVPYVYGTLTQRTGSTLVGAVAALLMFVAAALLYQRVLR